MEQCQSTHYLSGKVRLILLLSFSLVCLEACHTTLVYALTALLRNNKGIEIKDSSEVLPGDFVQFWKVFQGRAYGHCGIVLGIEPNKTLTLYSSHPFTGGYGTQEYLWPEKTYFVRLK